MQRTTFRLAAWGLALAAAIAAGARAEEAPRLALAHGGAGVIILPAERGKDTVAGAAELRDYLGRITGQEFPLVVEGQGVYQRVDGKWKLSPAGRGAAIPHGSPEIHVGWTARAQKEVDRAKVAALDVDGFLIKVAPDAVFLVGARDWSTAYACYTFLEDLCGVRWYLPGEFGEDVPRCPALSVPIMERTYEPAYKHRQYSGLGWRDQAEMKAWAEHRKIRERLQYHHNLYRVFDVAKYGQKYPDLYPTIEGRRRIPGPDVNSGWQPCLTHPRAVDLAMDYAREYFRHNPDAGSISLGINDGGRYCECPRCMQFTDPDLPKEARRARWYFQFANAVAERFDREFSDKEIGYLLYGECKAFPREMPINPRLIGFFVSPSSGLITPEGKQKFDDALDEAARHVPRFGLYDWFYGDGVTMPRMQIRQAQYWLQHGYEKGARHVKAEAYMNWGLDGFKYWMHSRLMWDPSLDVDAMFDEFFPRFFRESAEPMRQYFRVVERYTTTPILRPTKDDPQDLRPVNFRIRQPEQLLSFPPEAVRECEPLLEQAQQQARSFMTRQRVEYFRTAFNVTRMLTLQYHLASEAAELAQKEDTLPRGIALLAQAMNKDLDVAQYYRWALGSDPFCVRYPDETMFAPVTEARGRAAATLGQMVVDDLGRLGARPVTPADRDAVAGRVVARAVAAVQGAAALRVAKLDVAPFVGKIAICNRAAPPAVDGKLDDPCWQAAEFYGDMAERGTGQSAAHRTEFALCHDGSRLYLAVRCYQDTQRILAWTTVRDDRLWKEDSIELLLNRPTDTQAEERCQIMANSRGNIMDYFHGDLQWDGDIRVANQVGPEYFTIEMSVPLEQIGMQPAQGRFLRLNLVRNVYERKELGKGREAEIASWYLTPASNLAPQARGWLVFNP